VEAKERNQATYQYKHSSQNMIKKKKDISFNYQPRIRYQTLLGTEHKQRMHVEILNMPAKWEEQKLQFCQNPFVQVQSSLFLRREIKTELNVLK
jgi:hypothetical protein